MWLSAIEAFSSSRPIFGPHLLRGMARIFLDHHLRSDLKAGGLNLAIAAIILWNAVDLGRAVEELRSRGEAIQDDLIARVAPLGCEHIALDGDYIWPTEPLQDGFRLLRNPGSMFRDAA